MTWNLWWRFGAWEERLDAITQVIRAEQPDVACLQEVWSADGTSSAAVLGERLGLHYAITDDPFARTRREGVAGFHNAVLARWPISSTSSAALPNADGAPGHRRALVAHVATPMGSWPIISTHLDHRFDQSAVRRLQCDALLEVVAAHRGDPDRALPMVVCGDFNAVPDSDEIRRVTGRSAGPVPGLVLSDCWEQVGDGPGATWRDDNPYRASTAWPNRRLDYVFVSWPRPKPLGNPQRAWLAGLDLVDGVHPSDHAAVVVELVDAR